MVTSPRMKWFGLALLGAVQFMVVLDIAIVNVALPSIQLDLDVSQSNLQWVISAYALVFGGFLLLGGRTADVLGRRRIFIAGLALVAIALAPVLLAESRDTRVRTFDAFGAVLVTGGLSLLVLAITQGHGWGWDSARTIGVFAASAVLLVGFVAWENRVAEPLMRFGILRTKTVLGANVAGFILGTALFSMFLMLTLYMQQVLGYSAMKTGVAYLAVAGTSIIWANVAAMLVNRVGVRPLIAGGMALLGVGMLLFAQIPVDGTYVANLLPGFLIIALGMALCFVPISIAALAGVARAEAGIASGLINTSQQIGGAVGIALLSTIAITRTENEVAAGTAPPEALTSGFQLAFWVGAAIALAGVVAALVLIRQEEIAPAGEAAPAPRPPPGGNGS